MEQLFAPWRMEYIGAEQPSGCLFCRLRDASEAEDRQNLVVARRSGATVVMNRFPYNNGHLMIAPEAHVDNLTHLDKEAGAQLFSATQESLRVVAGLMHPEGFNVGVNIGKVAGAGIPDHVHIHVVPRWNGDTNFMPVLAEVKVINEHLGRTWEKLHEAFAAGT